MSHIVHQVHENFKSFRGTSVETISKAIAEFVLESGAAAKSIGIVHVNKAEELLFSLGFRTDEPSYPVALEAVALGHIDTLHAGGLDKLDTVLALAANGIDGIVCHELLVTPSGDFTVVFLRHTG